jgi:hypothetical protein
MLYSPVRDLFGSMMLVNMSAIVASATVAASPAAFRVKSFEVAIIAFSFDSYKTVDPSYRGWAHYISEADFTPIIR